MSKLNIYACSGVGLTSRAKAVKKSLDDAGWMRNETLRKYLGTSEDGGCAEYFLYTFIPVSDLGLYNNVIYNKRKQQLKTLDYVSKLFVGYNYGTEQEMIAIIRQGIETTFGVSVEDLLLDIRTGRRDAIGQLDPVTIGAIISAIVSIILAVISGIIEYCKSVKVAQYTAPTYQELADSTPASTDITGGVKKRGLLYLALAGAAVLVIRKIKK